MRAVARLVMLGMMIGSVLAVPAAAEGTKKKGDPDEVICEKQEILGSRLATRKVCRTRAEWAEERRLNRDAVDKSQIGSCMRRSGC